MEVRTWWMDILQASEVLRVPTTVWCQDVHYLEVIRDLTRVRMAVFLYDPYSGNRMVVDEDAPVEAAVDAEQPTSSTSSSSSSDELVADEDVHYYAREKAVETDSCFYALELDVSPEEGEWLSRHPRKAAVWLSKKMEAKSRRCGASFPSPRRRSSTWLRLRS